MSKYSFSRELKKNEIVKKLLLLQRTDVGRLRDTFIKSIIVFKLKIEDGTHFISSHETNSRT